jgi:low temperature requirement protein LtrA
MVGLAVEGPSYNLDDFQPTPFKSLSLILMVSRFVLAIQYAASWWWLKGYKKANIPLLIHVVTMFVTAIVFLGLAFGFNRSYGVHVIDGWYVLLGVEAMVILFVSGCTPFLNFRRTNIIERLGLLTLIILGEGVMGLGEAVSKIKDGDGIFSGDVIGQITCGVLIVYFLYMLYFDQIETKGRKIGSLRQQIWTIGHFPFHVCILLVVAGFSQFTIWRRIMDYLNSTYNIISAVNPPTANTTAAWKSYADALNATLNSNWPGLNFTSPLIDIADNPGNYTTSNDSFFEILGTVAQFVAEDYFEVDVSSDFNTTLSEGGYLDQLVLVYSTVFLYFFISAGFALIILACLFVLGKKSKTRVEYASIGVRLVVGIGLVLLSTMYATFASSTANDDVFFNYFSSPWMIPTVVLAYALGKLKVCIC